MSNSTPIQHPFRPAPRRTPDDRPVDDAAGHRNVRARTVAAAQPQACLFSIHQSRGWGASGPKFDTQPLARMSIRPGATFGDLDHFLREALRKDGHLSVFKVKTGRADPDLMGREEEIEVEGDFGDGYLDSEMRSKSTKVKSLVWATKASQAVWHFDMGNTTHIAVKAEHLASVADTVALNGAPIQDYRADAHESDEDEDEDEDTAGTFDDAYPSIVSAIINDGGLDIGKGACSSHYWATVWNEGGGLADMDQPCGGPHPIDSSLRSLEEDVGCEEGESPTPDTAAFSFEARYPKVAKFVSTKTQKRWIEIGTGRGGPVIKALKTSGVVWQSPLRELYNNSPHAALCALEKHLPQ